MNTMQEKTFFQLAGNSIDNTPVAELFKLTNEHPYFSAAQYFLSYKLKQENHQAFLAQLQKTVLFFNSPQWLHYQLLHKKSEIKILHKNYEEEETKPLLNHVIQEEIEQQQTASANHNEAVTAFLQETNQQLPVAKILPEEVAPDKKPQPEQVPAYTIATRFEENPSEEDHALEEIKEETPAFTMHIPTMESVREMMNNIQPPIQEVLPREIDVQEGIIAMEESPSITSFALEATEEYPFGNPVQETAPAEASTIEIAEHVLPSNDIVEEIESEVSPQSAVQDVSPAETVSLDQIPEEPLDNEEQPIEAESNLTPDKIASILNQQLEEFKKPVTEDTKLPSETEPYHTVDYFASQGIKVGTDNGSQDKLSKQLRKFTDWLKHMKQVEVDPNDLGTDPELETAIQSIAKTSNEAKEIVTETMAEVLEKQGKLDKAIQLYIKLSFLNPDKSAYFASKIQKLKGI